ncbi:MAG: dehalogenase [Dehalococcoides mccartyi]|uniref:Reductive dehalogenase anchoring protein n=1 Tax=Dehalococcoides mccartyi TaxID=61435 RepID=A0AB33HU09_9CHLR|nr:dehalogenase [Dehalococcoides mccartyi]BAZ97967.1 reductive dehalogenase anchoring protein [Dehalococcoides mccartyi]
MWTIDTLIWAVIGFVLGIGATLLYQSIRNQRISVRWYEMLIGAIGLVMFFFGLQNFLTGFAEFASHASLIFLLIVCLPGLLLFGLAFRLASMHKNVS